MVMKTLHIFLSSVVISFFVGCVSPELQAKVDRLDGGMKDMRSFQAEQTSKISTLDSELRQLSGRVEELEYAQNRRIGGDLDNLKRDLTDLRRRVPPPPIVPADVLERDEVLAQNMPHELGSVFGDALANIRAGKFGEALPQLREARVVGEGTEWAPEIIFWSAVVFDGSGDNRSAVDGYHALVSNYPRHAKASLALYREASALIRLGDSKMAVIVLKKLIQDYPRSSDAARAKEKLRDLKA
jgi:TolA-binding protein